MRPTIIIFFAIAGGICVAPASKTRIYIPLIKNRSIPREILDFRPSSISTAIGFGKRQSFFDVSKTSNGNRIFSMLLDDFPRRIPVEWLLQQIKTNPEFASRLMQLLLDERNEHLDIEKKLALV